MSKNDPVLHELTITLSVRSIFNSGKLEFLDMSALIRIMPFSAEMSRKQLSKEGMVAALQDVQGEWVREAAGCTICHMRHLRMVEKVGLECRPGSPSVLTEFEEGELASYCVKMADMGFGLSCNDVMGMAYNITENSGRKQRWECRPCVFVHDIQD